MTPTLYLHPLDLIRRYTRATKSLTPGTVMFCGTLPIIDQIAPGERFEISLLDPVKSRRIDHAYDVKFLPCVEES